MKTAKIRRSVTQRAAKPRRDRSNAIPAEARRSTAAALVKHAPGWCGDDLDEVIAIVTQTRAKTRF